MHKAIVAKIDKIEPIEGADRIAVAYVLGERVIVGKDVSEGFTGVLFPEGVALSGDLCKFNNLYRDNEMNNDKSKAGFFDKNRRVRAQKFMKVRSDAYFTTLQSLSAYTATR